MHSFSPNGAYFGTHSAGGTGIQPKMWDNLSPKGGGWYLETGLARASGGGTAAYLPSAHCPPAYLPTAYLPTPP
jgi:hypothetical protein